MSWYLTNLLATFLLPPLSLLLLLALGIYLSFRRRRHARKVILAACALLWLVSTPYVSDSALQWLESGTHAVDISSQQADAIVVLGGGTYFQAPEYAGSDTVSRLTLPRLRYGAHLHRATGKPILVSGGKPKGNEISEAQQMRAALEQDFRVPVQWTEDSSSNTFDNARHSFTVLQQQGIKRVYLVTTAWHMPRATMVFRRAGFEVVDAPTAFTTRYQTTLLTFLPSADAMQDSSFFVHELVGLLWYRLKLAFLK